MFPLLQGLNTVEFRLIFYFVLVIQSYTQLHMLDLTIMLSQIYYKQLTGLDL